MGRANRRTAEGTVRDASRFSQREIPTRRHGTANSRHRTTPRRYRTRVDGHGKRRRSFVPTIRRNIRRRSRRQLHGSFIRISRASLRTDFTNRQLLARREQNNCSLPSHARAERFTERRRRCHAKFSLRAEQSTQRVEAHR